MGFRPENFLILAENLMQDLNYKDEESTKRTFIGRVYYSLFLQIREALKLKHGVTFRSTPEDHKIVIVELQKLRGEFINISISLDKLRAMRNRSDYDLYNLDPRQIEKVIGEKENVLRLSKKCNLL